MIIVTLYNSSEDAISGDMYIPSIDFHFESLEEANELVDLCLMQGKCIVMSLEERTDRKNG